MINDREAWDKYPRFHFFQLLAVLLYSQGTAQFSGFLGYANREDFSKRVGWT